MMDGNYSGLIFTAGQFPISRRHAQLNYSGELGGRTASMYLSCASLKVQLFGYLHVPVYESGALAVDSTGVSEAAVRARKQLKESRERPPLGGVNPRIIVQFIDFDSLTHCTQAK